MTKQVYDNVYYQGQLLSFTKAPHLPKNDSRIVYVESPEEDITDIFNTTMCWRRYIGTWEIREDKIYLSHIEGHYQLATSEPILAYWFIGNLTIGFYSKSGVQQEIHLEVKHGLIAA